MDTSFLFCQSPENSPFFNLACYSDAAYQKGTVITMDSSLIMFKSAIGRNKVAKPSTMQVETEAALDSFVYLLRIINMLITMKYQVNAFLYVDNAPLLRTLHNNMAPATTGSTKLQVLRNAILKEVIRAGYVPGDSDPADVFTKGFPTSKLKKYFPLEGNKYVRFEYSSEPKDFIKEYIASSNIQG